MVRKRNPHGWRPGGGKYEVHMGTSSHLFQWSVLWSMEENSWKRVRTQMLSGLWQLFNSRGQCHHQNCTLRREPWLWNGEKTRVLNPRGRKDHLLIQFPWEHKERIEMKNLGVILYSFLAHIILHSHSEAAVMPPSKEILYPTTPLLSDEFTAASVTWTIIMAPNTASCYNLPYIFWVNMAGSQSIL